MKPQIIYAGLLISFLTPSLWARDFNTDMEEEFDQIAMEDISTTEASVYQSPRVVVKKRGRMQKQPTTYIEASPLSDSRADQIRRARQDAELETEQKIVEKLENSRMEDEKRRSQVLFGESLNTSIVQPSVQVQSVIQPSVQVQEVQVDSSPGAKITVQDAVKMSVADEKIINDRDDFLSGIVGFGEYPSMNNVKSSYSIGFNYGSLFDENLMLEGGFIYSAFKIDSLAPSAYAGYGGYNYGYGGYPTYPPSNSTYSYNYANSPYSYGTSYAYVPAFIDVKQYSAQFAAKYRFSDGVVKPTLGGVLQYSYREYSWENNYYQYSYYYNYRNADSHAVDVGISLGADFDMSRDVIVSLDYRYFKNIMNSSDDTHVYYIYSPQNLNPIEELDYYNIMLGLKIRI